MRLERWAVYRYRPRTGTDRITRPSVSKRKAKRWLAEIVVMVDKPHGHYYVDRWPTKDAM